MDTNPAPHRLDLIHQLPRDAYYQVMLTLRATMPAASDAPEDIVRRDNAVIAQVASLLPANPDEADLAAKYVAAGAHATECIRLARKYFGSPELVVKCTAQASSMFRQAKALRLLLMRVQAERRIRAADDDALERATQAEHAAIGHLAQAVADAPPAAPAPPQSAEPAADMATEADRYALAHRKRAMLIRRLGRVPDRLDFGAMPPGLVRAIVTGTSAILRGLDPKSAPAERLAA
jgi:hypothetical protein